MIRPAYFYLNFLFTFFIFYEIPCSLVCSFSLVIKAVKHFLHLYIMFKSIVSDVIQSAANIKAFWNKLVSNWIFKYYYFSKNCFGPKCAGISIGKVAKIAYQEFTCVPVMKVYFICTPQKSSSILKLTCIFFSVSALQLARNSNLSTSLSTPEGFHKWIRSFFNVDTCT